MHLQKIYDIISEYNDIRVERLRNTLKQYLFSEEDFNDIYNFIHINKLNFKWFEIINEYKKIDQSLLKQSIFFDIQYFKAICKYSNLDLSFNDNTLITHFLINEEFEGAIYLYNYPEVKESFNSDYFSEIVGEDSIKKFISLKNIKNF